MARVGLLIRLAPFFVVPIFCGHLKRARKVATTEEKFGVSTSLIIPCYYRDFEMLSVVLESLSRQTVMPDETLLVLSQDETNVEGIDLIDFDFPSISLEDMPKRRDSRFDPLPLQKEPPRLIGEIIRANGQPLEMSVLQIPKLKVLVRTGKYYAGHNRMHGIEKSRNETELFMFFDCDDYMHHRRTEYITKTFANSPELDAMIHTYEMLSLAKWYFTSTYKDFLKDMPYPSDPSPFPWTYREMRESVPYEKFAKDPDGEPCETAESLWYFPYLMNLTDRGPVNLAGANGWVTFRRRVLEKVKYPVERVVGEDSIFNYRILRAGLNWNYLPLTLGLYLHPQ